MNARVFGEAAAAAGRWAAALALAAAASGACADDPSRERRVLLVLPAESGIPWRAEMSRAVRSAFEEPAHSVFVQVEEVDVNRLQEEGYAARLRQWLTDKYRDAAPDLLVVPAPQSLITLADHAPEAWRSKPVVAAQATTQRTPAAWPGGIAGLRTTFDVRGTVEEAAALVPGTRRVAVVAGSAPDEQRRTAYLLEQLRALRGLELVDLTGLAFGDLQARLRALPADVIVLYLGLRLDAAGRSFVAERAMQEVAAASARPVFSMYEPLFGHGMVGGRIFDFHALGTALARLGQRVLAGEPAGALSFAEADFSRSVYDARELARWRLDAGLLPAGAQVLNREDTLLSRYRWGIFAIAAALLLQAALISALLVERERRRRAETRARRSLGQLAHLDRVAAMGELATSLAHELNQPLAAILANAQAARRLLAAASPDLAEVRASLDDIVDDDKRAGEVIRRMRALLKKDEFRPERVDLNDVVRNVLRLLAQDAVRRGVAIETDLGGGLPPVRGDAVQLQQVLLNLLVNAFDAVSRCPPERRRVWVRTAELPSGQLELTVRDAGEGIPQAHLAQLFEPFFTTKAEGLGMGLSIVRSILELHGGSISADAAGGGARFRCVLPRHGRGEVARPAEARAA